LRLIQRELDAVGPGVVGFFPRTFDDHVAVQLLPTRVAAYAAAVLGVFALVLSAAALYALVCWFVVLRRREMGVRMALGASPGEVRRLVVGQALSAALPGVIAGVLLTIALAFFARSALFGVGPADPVALGTGIVMLLLVVLVAGYIPSRAATALDPVQALRQ
jgi:ABC-type antimicrobial peptide transport system permease subunit